MNAGPFEEVTIEAAERPHRTTVMRQSARVTLPLLQQAIFLGRGMPTLPESALGEIGCQAVGL